MIFKAIVLQILAIFGLSESRLDLVRENPVAKKELWKQCTRKPDGTDTCGWGSDGCFFPDDSKIG